MLNERMGASDMGPEGQDRAMGPIWEEAARGTVVPDQGWTQHYDVLKELGDCHAALGEYEQARQCYDRAATLAPDEPGPYIGLGVIALQKDELDDADTAFRVACRLDESCSKAYAGRAMVSQRRNRRQEAFDLYLRSLELNADDLTALLGLFQLSCEIGSFSKVIHFLEVYLEMHPGDVSVMFCLAGLHAREGKLAAARRLLRDLLLLQPAHIDAANLLEEVEHSLAQTVQ